MAGLTAVHTHTTATHTHAHIVVSQILPTAPLTNINSRLTVPLVLCSKRDVNKSLVNEGLEEDMVWS